MCDRRQSSIEKLNQLIGLENVKNEINLSRILFFFRYVYWARSELRMSRQLVFWKYEGDTYLDNQKVYESISNMDTIEGLFELPIEDILERISLVFYDYDKLDEYNYEGNNGSFTVITTEQSVIFDCGFGVPEGDLNRIIDLMLEYDCPCYDPQINVRFDGK